MSGRGFLSTRRLASIPGWDSQGGPTRSGLTTFLTVLAALSVLNTPVRCSSGLCNRLSCLHELGHFAGVLGNVVFGRRRTLGRADADIASLRSDLSSCQVEVRLCYGSTLVSLTH